MNKGRSLYNKQRTFCVSILRKSKRDYFGNLNNKIVTDNRKFWKTISPLFSEKAFHRECITLKERNKTITNNVELAETFNTFFSKIVPNLNIDNNLGDNITKPNITDPVFCAIQKYEKHPSILKIKEMMGKNNLSFSFKFTDRKKIFNELQKLKSKKACQISDIPVKIIKENINIITDFIYNNFNNSLFSSYFPSNLKNADITPVFKKKDRENVENYRPVSILPVLSKVYERCMYDQMYAYLNKILSKWQCGFRQGYSTQHCLLIMTEKWRQCLDKGGISGALLTDLSKAFDCLLHDLLIAKLAAYGFDYDSLVFIQSYLSERQQRTKVNNAYSTYSDILYGVPQGSILDPLLFNIYISDTFYNIDSCDIAIYADNKTSYTSEYNLEEVIHKLELITSNLLEWFKNNHMKANAGK